MSSGVLASGGISLRRSGIKVLPVDDNAQKVTRSR